MMHKFLILIALVASIFTSATDAQGIEIPQGNTAFLGVQGIGNFTYICENTEFKLKEGSGSLNEWDNQSNIVGSFFFNRLPNSDETRAVIGITGPAVTFRLDATIPSSGVDSIPDAKYSVVTTSSTTGPLEGVTFAQSVNTFSDQVPKFACANDETKLINFRAYFIFYKAYFIPPSSTIQSNGFTNTPELGTYGIQPTTYDIPPPYTYDIPPTYTIQSTGFTNTPELGTYGIQPTTYDIPPPYTYDIPPTTSTVAETGTSASQPTEAVYIPSDIAVPDSNVERFRYRGTGYYTTRCISGAWQNTDLVGKLFRMDDPSVLVGALYIAPEPDADGGQIVFEVNGGRAIFKLIGSAASDTELSIPKALFQSTTVDSGPLDNVSFVQRLNTLGGISLGRCLPTDVDRRAPFTADFAFFFSS